MQRLEVSGAVRPIYGSLGVKRLRNVNTPILRSRASFPSGSTNIPLLLITIVTPFQRVIAYCIQYYSEFNDFELPYKFHVFMKCDLDRTHKNSEK